MNMNKSPFWEAFDSRVDLKQYGVDALLLFALQLKFGIEDIDIISLEVATDMWTPIVNAASAFTEPLVEGLADGFKAHEKVNRAIKEFQSRIYATKDANGKIYESFAAKVA